MKKLIKKIFFWIFVVAVGFANPLFSIGLVVLYYAPGLIRSICSPVTASSDDLSSAEISGHDKLINSGMKSFSDYTLEKMK